MTAMRAMGRPWQGFFGSPSLMVIRVAEALLLGLQWRQRPTI
jgi:hypothetical protein